MLAFVDEVQFCGGLEFFELRFQRLVISAELSGVGQNFKKPQSRGGGERDSSGIQVNRVKPWLRERNFCY